MGRGSSGIGSGGGSGNGSGSGKVSVTAATRALNANKEAFVEGNPPATITVNGVKMKGGSTGSYVSNGGFTVRTYKYSADKQIVDDGRDSITFSATDYKTADGKKAKYFERDKPKVYNVKITGRNAYSTGRSGGI